MGGHSSPPLVPASEDRDRIPSELFVKLTAETRSRFDSWVLLKKKKTMEEQSERLPKTTLSLSPYMHTYMHTHTNTHEERVYNSKVRLHLDFLSQVVMHASGCH